MSGEVHFALLFITCVGVFASSFFGWEKTYGQDAWWIWPAIILSLIVMLGPLGWMLLTGNFEVSS